MAGEGAGCPCSMRRSSFSSASSSSSSDTVRRASMASTPRARNAAYRSSRCCASSSITAECRVGSISCETRRWRTACAHSDISCLRDAIDGGDEPLPPLALLGEHRASVAGETVVAPPPLSRLLDPGADDPAAALEAIEQRIQRSDLELHVALGALFDDLTDLIA